MILLQKINVVSVRGPTQILKDYMTGDREINQSVVEHVVNMRNRLVEFTSMVKRNLENRKEKVKLWYDKNDMEKSLYP
jgi:predicted TIM-barrel fold metal-dependent hydrolase